jgi:hypothetical protein
MDAFWLAAKDAALFEPAATLLAPALALFFVAGFF